MRQHPTEWETVPLCHTAGPSGHLLPGAGAQVPRCLSSPAAAACPWAERSGRATGPGGSGSDMLNPMTILQQDSERIPLYSNISLV